MADGAHLNIGVDSAMRAIVGGKEVKNTYTEEEFEQLIREAPRPTDWNPETGYADSGNFTARLVLEMYERYPQTQSLAEDRVYLRENYPQDPWGSWVGGLDDPVVLNVTIYDIFKRVNSEENLEAVSGISGFQWGWAVNAARHILGLGPVPNPAILDVVVGQP